MFGNLLFTEIDQFKTLQISIQTLYEASIGGFDFSIFEDIQRIDLIYAQMYLVIYLLLATILLLNFLIAILADTYTNYINIGIALKNIEIIKLRLIYEKHPHYHCLVKGVVLLHSIPVLLMTPVIICLKSKTLNRSILFVEHFMCSVVNIVLIIINISVSLPVFIVTMLVIKISNFPKYSTSILDKIVRIIDIVIFPLFVLILMPLVYFTVSSNNLVNVYAVDYFKMAEKKKDEFKYINNLMQKSADDQYSKQIDSKVRHYSKVQPMGVVTYLNSLLLIFYLRANTMPIVFNSMQLMQNRCFRLFGKTGH